MSHYSATGWVPSSDAHRSILTVSIPLIFQRAVMYARRSGEAVSVVAPGLGDDGFGMHDIVMSPRDGYICIRFGKTGNFWNADGQNIPVKAEGSHASIRDLVGNAVNIRICVHPKFGLEAYS